jgi:hypothetical protein
MSDAPVLLGCMRDLLNLICSAGRRTPTLEAAR